MPYRFLRSPRQLLAVIALLVSVVASVKATSPDFSTVNDILGGRRTLFPTDDIVVTLGGISTPTVTTVLQTKNDAISSLTPYTIAPGVPSLNSTVTAVARMFNLPSDVVVTVAKGQTNLVYPLGGINTNFPNSYSGFYQNLYSPNAHVVTDLTGNGFAGLVFPDINTSALITMTAADTNDPSQGFFYGTPFGVVDVNYLSLTAADFDGDGINEIALASTNNGNIVVTILKPISQTNAEGNKVTSLSLQQTGSISVPYPSDGSGFFSITAGSFGGIPTPRLVLAYTNGSQTNVQPIIVTTTSNPAQVTLALGPLFTLAQNSSSGLQARSGYLNFFDNTEQLVLEVQSGSAKIFDVLTFDANMNASLANSLTSSTSTTSYGFTLGNFDQQVTDGNTLTLEIAELYPSACGNSSGNFGSWIQIYHVNPSANFEISKGNSAQVGSLCYEGLLFDNAIVAGDTQGRSLALGAPSKLVAQHVQPQVILGAPPMHIDYITPANGTTPEVLNLSSVPHGFFSSYQTEVTDQAQSSHQGTTSYTNAVKGSISGGYKFDVPFVESVSATVTASAGYMHKNFVEKQYGQYSSTSFDASTNTGFDDQIWFSSETHNIYIYPVIAQTACPADSPNCSESQKEPLAVMFSGPSNQSQMSVGGSVLEWYQPVNELGNIFSYPWTFDQLQAAEGDISLLTAQDPTSFSTDSSTHTATASWSGQSSSNVTSGSTSNISWGASVSITEKAGIFGGPTGNQSFSYNGSKAVGSLNTQTTKLGESAGIGIVKPGTFPNPDLYQYPIFPYIFGNNPAPGTVQEIDLSTDIQTNGILHAAFTADPTDLSAGAWWQDAYALPDVALAHPARWSFNLITPSGPLPNCIPINTTSRNQDCASFNAPQTDIWTSEFHWLKGLMITPADANGQGPQINQATAGKQIQLQARVYNNSLTDMPTDSEIVVQFYGQPWDPTELTATGNAFLIDEVELPPLPGFNSVSSQGTNPNWTIASTTKLDTTPYSDQYLAFWVLVYTKETTGNLAPELRGHGLTSIPPALDSISNATPYLEPYSNNIGFYKSLFYVEPVDGTETVAPGEAGLSLHRLKVSSSRVSTGQKVTISAKVHSKKEIDGLSILFYDGNPDTGGKLFDVDQISHIRANGFHLAKTVYHADLSGLHDLHVRILEAPANGKAFIKVLVRPTPAIIFPSGPGITVKQKKQMRITWTNFSGPFVKIQLNKGGKRLIEIARTRNDGYFLWTVPGFLKAGSDYTITVASGSGVKQSASSEGPFTIESLVSGWPHHYAGHVPEPFPGISPHWGIWAGRH